jgi:hypothetical protein
MSLVDVFTIEPFLVNQPLYEDFLLEPDAIEVWISSVGVMAPAGSGTIVDPYNADIVALDTLLDSFPPRTTIHFGPGEFLTSGSQAWSPKSGWRIVGCGYDLTTLVLDSVVDDDNVTAAIGAPPSTFLEGLEVADLTIHCAIDSQPPHATLPFPPIACAGISATGSHIFINRVRVTNFGTQKEDLKGFAISIGNVDPSTPEVVDCVIADCII